MDKVFCFWEGEMSPYIKLCMKTWDFPFILLNYKNLNDYTSLPIERLKRYTLPQISDVVRTHVLRDHGGYWLDCDTIVISELPKVNIMGVSETREVSIGFLYIPEANNPMYVKWCEFQRKIYMDKKKRKDVWSLMGNDFVNSYVKEHLEVQFGSRENCFPEQYLIKTNETRYVKYPKFYFQESFHLNEIRKTPIVMLHNSWTPKWFKRLSEKEVLEHKCTMSNFIREALK